MQTAVQLLGYVGGTLVIPQSVLVRRIERDTVEAGARQWRLDHVAEYEAALPWLREAGEVVDTAGSVPAEVARRIVAAVGAGAVPGG